METWQTPGEGEQLNEERWSELSLPLVRSDDKHIWDRSMAWLLRGFEGIYVQNPLQVSLVLSFSMFFCVFLLMSLAVLSFSDSITWWRALLLGSWALGFWGGPLVLRWSGMPTIATGFLGLYLMGGLTVLSLCGEGIYTLGLNTIFLLPLLGFLGGNRWLGMFFVVLSCGLLIWFRGSTDLSQAASLMLSRSYAYAWTMSAIGAVLALAVFIGLYERRRRLTVAFADRAFFSLREINQELLSANRKALKANQTSSRFLKHVNYDLRTPLNTILGYSELLGELAIEVDAEVLIPDLQKIQKAGLHLLTQVDDLLDLTQIESGQMELFVEEITISSLLSDVWDTLAPLAKKNLNTMSFEVPEEPIVLHNDNHRLKQLLLNLLSNACKFTHEGSIVLRVSRERLDGREGVLFQVQDDGIGIKSDDLRRLFRPFVQADSSSTRRYGGTGLGLVICKRLCSLMGGRITVQSEWGKGSLFSVHLPVQILV